MDNIINKLIVLKLNAVWQPIGYSTVGKAIVDLAGGISQLALDIEYETDENGEPIGDPICPRPVDWEEWITLPVRPYDFVVHYANGAKQMRVPTVLVARNYAKMPKKHFKGKPSKDAIWIRDNGTDQYTGKKLKREEATVDHVLPKSRGGPDTWENLVTCHKKLNVEKGNMTNEEWGRHLIKKPGVPKPMPLSSLIREVKHRDWKMFLLNIDD